jgi:hypothetical protein
VKITLRPLKRLPTGTTLLRRQRQSVAREIRAAAATSAAEKYVTPSISKGIREGEVNVSRCFNKLRVFHT